MRRYCNRCHEMVETRSDRGSSPMCVECGSALSQAGTEPDDEFGRECHNRHYPNHSRRKGHYCGEFDGLWICEDCPEFQHCICFDS